MAETEAIHTIAQFIGWIGLLALSPMLYRLAYAFSYYISGRLKKREKLIVQILKDGVVINETEVTLDSKSPLVEQLKSIKKVTS